MIKEICSGKQKVRQKYTEKNEWKWRDVKLTKMFMKLKINMNDDKWWQMMINVAKFE